MTRFVLLPFAVVMTFGATTAIADADKGGRKLQTTLTGAAEVPGPADPDGSGAATVTVNPGQMTVCYTIAVQNIGAATMAHIHSGAAGTAPPNNVVVGLTPPTNGASEGCATVTRDLAQAILKDPANYYVNVHNSEFPKGAVRGQLAK